MNLTIKCASSEIDPKGVFLTIKAFCVANWDAIAKEISDQVDPGSLVTESNQVQFLDVMDLKFIKQYVRDRES